MRCLLSLLIVPSVLGTIRPLLASFPTAFMPAPVLSSPRAAILLADAGDPNQPADEPTDTPAGKGLDDYEEDLRAGIEFGKEIRSRFTAPVIDDAGLPWADSLVIVCGTLFVSALGLKGIIPRPSWLVPIDVSAVGLEARNLRGLPYIFPAWSHASALVACWVPGALAAAAFEKGAFTGSLSEAIRRTWKAGAFATGVLLLCTQATTASSLAAAGIDQVGSPNGIGWDGLKRMGPGGMEGEGVCVCVRGEIVC